MPPPKLATGTAALRTTLLLILLATFALRLHELTRQNIWWDEARNIDVALRPFTQIAGAPELDIQPPFYFWLLHGWDNLAGMTSADPTLIAFWARFLSVAAGLFGLVHAGGGPTYVVLATLAGVGYGWVFLRTGRIEASILTHFALNAVHFLGFTYPALAR